jgi:hypothetical protein
VPVDLLTTLRGEQFLFHDSGADDPRCFLIFCTNNNVTVLQQHHDWYVDGTFLVVPHIFFQLYTVHAVVEGKNLLSVHILMSDKSEQSYNRVFNVLEAAVNPPSTIMMDFEKAAQNAWQQTYPTAEISGCFFHLGQCVYRKIQQLGLSGPYLAKDNFRVETKLLPALAFLPPDDVIDGYEQLRLDVRLTPLQDYFEDTFIGRELRCRRMQPLFPVRMWNVHERIAAGMPKTNNAVEGWHRALTETLLLIIRVLFISWQ